MGNICDACCASFLWQKVGSSATYGDVCIDSWELQRVTASSPTRRKTGSTGECEEEWCSDLTALQAVHRCLARLDFIFRNSWSSFAMVRAFLARYWSWKLHRTAALLHKDFMVIIVTGPANRDEEQIHRSELETRRNLPLPSLTARFLLWRDELALCWPAKPDMELSITASKAALPFGGTNLILFWSRLLRTRASRMATGANAIYCMQIHRRDPDCAFPEPPDAISCSSEAHARLQMQRHLRDLLLVLQLQLKCVETWSQSGSLVYAVRNIASSAPAVHEVYQSAEGYIYTELWAGTSSSMGAS